MRAYFFVHSALSDMQKGIQVAHTLSDLYTKYWKNPIPGYYEPNYAFEKIIEWGIDHQTIIVLNGGFQQDLLFIKYIFECGGDYRKTGIIYKMTYPWTFFREDEQTMNQMVTCVGIILPDNLANYAKAVRENDQDKIHSLTETLNPCDLEIVKLINSCPLA